MTEGHEPAEGDAAHAGGDDAKKEDKRIAWSVRPPRSHTLASGRCLVGSFRWHPGNGHLQYHPPRPPFVARGSRGDQLPPPAPSSRECCLVSCGRELYQPSSASADLTEYSQVDVRRWRKKSVPLQRKRAWHYQNGQTGTGLDCLSFRAIASSPTQSLTHYGSTICPHSEGCPPHHLILALSPAHPSSVSVVLVSPIC